MSEPDAAIPGGLAALLAQRPSLTLLSGAGLSAESGIPTFREAQTGLWARFSPQELATPEAFAADPQRIWDWYRWRRQLVIDGGPNAAHRAIAEMQANSSFCRVVTQNVDGLHQAAGADGVIELHGNLWRQRCANGCGYEETVDSVDEGPPPACPDCGGHLRPAVVWFGEMLPAGAMQDAAQAVRRSDLVIVVGTSNLVYPAAALPEQAVAEGKTVVEINPSPTPLSRHADFYLQATACGTLPAMAEKITGATHST